MLAEKFARRESPIDPNDIPPSNYRRFACAFLLTALQDALDGDKDARAWIESLEGHRWAELLSLPSWPQDFAPVTINGRRVSLRYWARLSVEGE